MLARRMQGNGKGAPGKPPAGVFTHGSNVAARIASNMQGAPIAETDPRIVLTGGSSPASYQTGTITIGGRSLADAGIDLGASNGYTICRTSEGGVIEPIERLPVVASGGMVCGDWRLTVGVDTSTTRSLRTNATANLAIGSFSYQLYNAGNAVVAVRKASGGSVDYAFASQGVYATINNLPGNTSRPYNIRRLEMQATVVTNRLDCQVNPAAGVLLPRTWELGSPPSPDRILSNIAFTTRMPLAAHGLTPELAARQGRAYIPGTVTICEVDAVSRGGSEQVGPGGFTYRPVTLKIRIIRKQGFLVVSPDGAVHVIAVRTETYVREADAMLNVTGSGRFALGPNMEAWGVEAGAIPAEVEDRGPLPASVQALPDRLVGHIVGGSSSVWGMWTYDGTFLGNTGSGLVLRGEPIMYRPETTVGGPWYYSRDFGQTWSLYTLAPGETRAAGMTCYKSF